MALQLPRVFVPRASGAPIEVSRAHALAADEVAALERLAPEDAHLAEHFVLLKQGRWAVGRTTDAGTVWRVGDESARERLFHPAWLWRDDDALAPNGDEAVHVAPALPLRNLVRDALPMFGTVYNTCRCLAATVAALRRRKRPVAVVPLWGDDPARIGAPGRAFLLAVLTALPLAWRARLRISTRQTRPDPEAWDLVVVGREVKGFTHVLAEAAPDVESDLVASYILDRLKSKDPEAVEACAYLVAKDGPDPWAEGVRAHLAGGIPGVSALAEEQIERDPKGAVRAVCRRIEVGSPMRGAALTDLAALTARTWAPRPWQLLAKREPAERARALLGALPHLDPAGATADFCKAATACAVGEATGAWGAFLVQVLRAADDPSFALEQLAEVVGSEKSPLDAATRASLWQEVTVALVERHESTLAAEELLSAASRRVADAGGGSSLAHGFLALPEGTRTVGAERAVIEAIAASPKPDHALLQLWRGLGAQATEDGPSPQHEALHHWARIRTQPGGPDLPNDELLTALRDTPHAAVWAAAVAPLATREALPALLKPAIPTDPEAMRSFFRAAELARATTLRSDARTRLADMAIWLPEAGTFVEPLARELLTEALPALDFPAADVAAASAELAEQPEVSPVWMWLAITAHEPGAFHEETVDATVVAFAQVPPTADADRAACHTCAERLGQAHAWSGYEQARWIARLCMAPDGDRTGFAVALAGTLVRTLAARADGVMLMTQVTREFLQLPADHPALRIFLRNLLPGAWTAGPPAAYREAIASTRGDPETIAMWRDAIARR